VLHSPDNKTPIEEQAGTIASLPQPWGVSNISPTILREMVDFVDKHGLPRPTTYQGIYNPIHRTGESDLLPLLKELNMNFYAYSPLAGGIFAKPLEKILAPEKGDRYDAMKFFGGMYLSNPAMVDAIKDLARTCQTNNLSLLEATIRWFRWHSALGEGDGVIFGCSRIEQFEEAAKFFESEKLSGEMVEAFEQLWRSIPEEARSPSYFDAGAAKKATEKYGKP
jgi:aflatoxin B1 aldehyde reductase